MSTAIHWFRRDLRIADNTALNAAAAGHDQVVPVYLLSEWEGEHHWTGPARQQFLLGCLASLQKNLEARGGRLLIRQGRAEVALEQLIRESGATTLCYNRDPDPFGRAAEAKVDAMASRLGVKVIACQDHALHEREELLTGEGRPFRVFTPYSRAWTKLDKPAPARSLAKLFTPPKLTSLPLPTLQRWGFGPDSTAILEPGEAAARKRLARFLDGPILLYSVKRDLPDDDGTSRISQDLRFGTLSIREVYAKCQQAAASGQFAGKQSVAVFINELIWREFYFQVLWHRPDVLEHEYQERYRNLAWRGHWRPEEQAAWAGDPLAKEHFERWCSGQTGFPIVDAGMRQLNATGFMHNRLRMITAMFLTKDLRLWWMHGESYFMRRLVDGEIASNNGGWQWSAGTGTDAAPYFRIQNPWTQTKRFDPTGSYIKRWVPELSEVPAASLCTPPPAATRLAPNYPPPAVDHRIEREAALEMFRTTEHGA